MQSTDRLTITPLADSPLPAGFHPVSADDLYARMDELERHDVSDLSEDQRAAVAALPLTTTAKGMRKRLPQESEIVGVYVDRQARHAIEDARAYNLLKGDVVVAALRQGLDIVAAEVAVLHLVYRRLDEELVVHILQRKRMEISISDAHKALKTVRSRLWSILADARRIASPEAQRERITHHEAGHCVIGSRLGVNITGHRIDPTGSQIFFNGEADLCPHINKMFSLAGAVAEVRHLTGVPSIILPFAVFECLSGSDFAGCDGYTHDDLVECVNLVERYWSSIIMTAKSYSRMYEKAA